MCENLTNEVISEVFMSCVYLKHGLCRLLLFMNKWLLTFMEEPLSQLSNGIRFICIIIMCQYVVILRHDISSILITWYWQKSKLILHSTCPGVLLFFRWPPCFFFFFLCNGCERVAVPWYVSCHFVFILLRHQSCTRWRSRWWYHIRDCPGLWTLEGELKAVWLVVTVTANLHVSAKQVVASAPKLSDNIYSK